MLRILLALGAILLASLLGLSLRPESATAATTLQNGVPAVGLEGAIGTATYFTITLPAGASNLQIRTYGGSGNVALGIGQVSPPNASNSLCWSSGNNPPTTERTCTIASPQSGVWKIVISASAYYSGVSLVATFLSPDSASAQHLSDQSLVTNMAAAKFSGFYFLVDVPTGKTSLTIRIVGGTGNADLIVRRGAVPTDTTFDCRPTGPIGANPPANYETCTWAAPQAGSWYVYVYASSAYAEVTLQVSTSTAPLPTVAAGDSVPLTLGMSVGPIDGAKAGLKRYVITVPEGASNLEIRIWGSGAGNADLYVRQGQQPTTRSYTCRPNLSSSIETCKWTNVQSGDWHILIYGKTAYTALNLIATYQLGTAITPPPVTPPPPTTTAVPLVSGTPVNGLSGAINSDLYYLFAVPVGAISLQVTLAGGAGDADLWMNFGQLPTETAVLCASTANNNNELCAADGPAPGNWYIRIHGAAAFSGVTLLATYGMSPLAANVTSLASGSVVPVLSGATGSQKLYVLTVPANTISLQISIAGGSGDADLYVRLGQFPTLLVYGCRPYLDGNDETCSGLWLPPGDYYILIHGASAYSGLTLTADYTFPALY